MPLLGISFFGGAGLAGLLLFPCLASLLLLPVGGLRFHGFLRGEFLGALYAECVRWPDVPLVGGEGALGSFFLGDGKETLSMAVLGCSGLPDGAIVFSVLVGVGLLLSLGAVHSVLSIFSTVILGGDVVVSACIFLISILLLVDTGLGNTSAIFHFFVSA